MFFLPALKKNGHLDLIHLTICVVGSRKIVAEDDYENKGWNIFAPNLTIYGFDADLSTCDQMNENIASRQVSWTEKHFPLGLGNLVGNAKLYLTNFPGCSSLYPPNEIHMSRFNGYLNLIKLSSEIEVKITTLDNFCQLEGVKEIDFMQLDVQGGELQVLEGASSILQSVLAVITEVEFTDIYLNQPLFGDIDNHMRTKGFSLMDLEITTGRAIRTVSPICSSQRPGSLIWADAVYFRDLIRPDFRSSLEQPEKIFKLACLADIMGFPDYALEILEYLTLNYGVNNPQYNFADIIIESLSQVPVLVEKGIENLPIVNRLKDYASESIRSSVDLFAVRGDQFQNKQSFKKKMPSKVGDIESYLGKLCKFLKYRDEISVCTEYLHGNGYVSHSLNCKDWDLAHIIYDLSDGNILDMGSSDSYILKNAVLKNTQGEKYGIDLRPPDVVVKGVKYVIGDLMDTKLPDSYFQNITCLSVIEHEVDIQKFVTEVSRILSDSGKLYLTFDYWNPKLKTTVKLYGLAWSPLDQDETQILIKEFESKNLYLVDEVDWCLGEGVIREGYHSPEKGISYTFGMLVFQKDIVSKRNSRKKINEILLLSKLREINLIICPDWSVSENLLLSELEEVIHALITHPHNSLITLCIETNNILEDDANLIISAVIMNVLMSRDLDTKALPEILLVDSTAIEQWDSFLSDLNARIILTHENQEIVTQLELDSLSAVDINNIHNIKHQS